MCKCSKLEHTLWWLGSKFKCGWLQFRIAYISFMPPEVLLFNASLGLISIHISASPVSLPLDSESFRLVSLSFLLLLGVGLFDHLVFANSV